MFSTEEVAHNYLSDLLSAYRLARRSVYMQIGADFGAGFQVVTLGGLRERMKPVDLSRFDGQAPWFATTQESRKAFLKIARMRR